METDKVSDHEREGPASMRIAKLSGKGEKKKLKYKLQWRQCHYSLIAGSLYYYTDIREPIPKGHIQLDETVFFEEPPDMKPYRPISLHNTKGDLVYFLSFEDEETRTSWLAAIEAGKKFGPAPPVSKERKASRMKELRDRATKNIAGKAVTSPMGKRAVRAKAPKEVTDLIAAIKAIIERESGSTRRANEIEDTLYKTGVKIFFLAQNGKFKVSDVLVADKPLRQALELFCRCRNHVADRMEPVGGGRRNTVCLSVNTEGLMERLRGVQALILDAADKLKKVIGPYLKPKSIARIDDMVAYGSNPDVLYKILLDRTMSEELFELVSAGQHYSQFHFYADE